MAKRVRAETRFLTPGPQPNGLQAVADGLWVMDQRDQHIYKLAWSDGALLHKAPTAAAHASGITWDGYHLWLASTFTPQVLLQVDPATGNEIRRLPSPGVETGQGPHGLEWIAGLLWVTVPDPVNTTFQLEPASGRVWRQFPAPGTVTHGLAWDGAGLWCAERRTRTLVRYSLTGEVLDELAISDGPDPHGLTWHDGQLWYCDADSRAVCTITP